MCTTLFYIRIKSCFNVFTYDKEKYFVFLEFCRRHKSCTWPLGDRSFYDISCVLSPKVKPAKLGPWHGPRQRCCSIRLYLCFLPLLAWLYTDRFLVFASDIVFNFDYHSFIHVLFVPLGFPRLPAIRRVKLLVRSLLLRLFYFVYAHISRMYDT